MNFSWEATENGTYELTFPNGHKRNATATERELIAAFDDARKRLFEDRRRYVTTEQFKEVFARAAEEVARDASLEGRIEWSAMNGIIGHPESERVEIAEGHFDDAFVPKGKVAMRCFIRIGNDMGQGGAMLIEKGVGE